jgi:uncharacterized membrane protein
MHVFHDIIQTIIPAIVFILEVMGVLIVFWTCIKSFWEYIQNTFMKRHLAIQTHLAKGLATGLEFKLGAEILKTLVVHDLDELLVLGAVFALRALMSILIHFELKHSKDADEDDD